MKAPSISIIAALLISKSVQGAPVGAAQGIIDWLDSIAAEPATDSSPTTQAAAPEPETTTPPTTLVTSAAPATSAAATESSSGSSGFNLDSLLSNGKVKEWLSYFGIDDSEEDTTTSTEDDTPFSWFTFPGKGSTSAATSTVLTQSTPPTTSASPTTSSPTTTTSSTSESTSTSSGSSSGGVTGSDKKFAQDILDVHNKYRKIHQAGALTWNDDAYQYAQNNADNYDCSGVLTHTHGQYGENLAAGFHSGESAVKAWYDESKDYNYQSPNSYDHFTQLVWKGTTSMGCAYKDCSKEGWALYVVCEYDPPGNVIGQRAANVLPSSS